MAGRQHFVKTISIDIAHQRLARGADVPYFVSILAADRMYLSVAAAEQKLHNPVAGDVRRDDITENRCFDFPFMGSIKRIP